MEQVVTAESMIKSLGLEKRKTSGILFRWKSFWVGCHYSDHCRRFCLNIVPCVTIWWTIKEGQAPRKTL